MADAFFPDQHDQSDQVDNEVHSSFSKSFFLFSLYLVFLSLSTPSWSASLSSTPPSRLSFGSCNKHDLPQPLWKVMEKNHPELWIWTGDIIYGDTEDKELLGKKYDLQKKHQDYVSFMKKTLVVGVWDDHDYGLNNGGKEYSSKKESQQKLLDFLDEPTDSPRRLQEGVYASYEMGPPGQQIKILLLDARYHRDPPGPQGDILGEAQWDWLEKELSQSSAQIHLIVSGIQIIPTEHVFEKWADFPAARQKLLQLLKKLRVPGVIFITGDRHFAEISRLPPSPTSPQGPLYPLYEITSSGLTHTYDKLSFEYNPYRVGKIFKELHFGHIEILWDHRPVQIHLQIRDKQNAIPVEVKVPLTELLPPPQLQGKK